MHTNGAGVSVRDKSTNGEHRSTMARRMLRAYSTIEIKSVSESERVLEGIASTPTTDRDGDVVEPGGAAFKLPIPLLWMHDSRLPVGEVFAATVTAKGIKIKAKIFKTETPGALKDRLDEAFESVRIGLVRGLSIGFKSLERAYLEETGGIHFLKWLWLELSAVTIAANADASITAIKSLDRQQLAAVGTARAVRSDTQPAAVGVRSKDATMNVSDRLTSSLAELNTKRLRLEALETMDGAEGGLEAAETAERDQLGIDVPRLTGTVSRLKAIEAANAAAAPQIIVKASSRNVRDDDELPRIDVPPARKLDPGIALAQVIICRGHALLTGASPLEVAKARFGHSADVVRFLKEAVAGASTYDSTNAAPLVYAQNLTSEFIEFLRPTTVIGRIEGMTKVPFNVRIPGQTSGGSASWVGEGRAKPVTAFGFNDVLLLWAKVAAITVQTAELFRFSNPSSETILRNALAGAIRERIDIDFLDPEKAPSAHTSPGSITYGLTPLTSSGNDLDAVDADVRAMFSAFINANITPSSGVWIMPQTLALNLSLMRNAQGNRAFPEITMNGGTFYGLPVVASQYCVFGTPARSIVVLANAEDIFLSDDGGISIDVSREATIEMDDAPTQSVGPLGSPAGAVGGSSAFVNMFQTNSLAIRAERYINWARRRDAGVVLMDSVEWTPGGSSV